MRGIVEDHQAGPHGVLTFEDIQARRSEAVVQSRFGVDASRLFYTTSVGKLGHYTDLWMAGVEPIAPAVKLNAPHPPSGYLPLILAIASDMSRIVYAPTTMGFNYPWTDAACSSRSTRASGVARISSA